MRVPSRSQILSTQRWEKIDKSTSQFMGNLINLLSINVDFQALYYAALSSYELKNFDDAIEFCRRGIKVAPTSPEMTELYTKLVGQQKRYLEKEKLMCKRIFANAQSEGKKDEFALVSQDVRKHTAEQLKKMKDNSNLVEVPMNYVFFDDKLSLRFLEKKAVAAGLVVRVQEGKSRKIIRLRRS